MFPVHIFCKISPELIGFIDEVKHNFPTHICKDLESLIYFSKKKKVILYPILPITILTIGKYLSKNLEVNDCFTIKIMRDLIFFKNFILENSDLLVDKTLLVSKKETFDFDEMWPHICSSY